MTRKYRVLKVSENGDVIDDGVQGPVLCPVRGGNCNSRCAWYSVGTTNGIAYCQDTAIGALQRKPLKSFRLYMGPEV